MFKQKFKGLHSKNNLKTPCFKDASCQVSMSIKLGK